MYIVTFIALNPQNFYDEKMAGIYLSHSARNDKSGAALLPLSDRLAAPKQRLHLPEPVSFCKIVNGAHAPDFDPKMTTNR